MMHVPIYYKDFQPGDKVRSIPHVSANYHQILTVKGNLVTYIHSRTGECCRNDNSSFSHYDWEKLVEFVPYDPNQMASDEDDL